MNETTVHDIVTVAPFQHYWNHRGWNIFTMAPRFFGTAKEKVLERHRKGRHEIGVHHLQMQPLPHIGMDMNFVWFAVGHDVIQLVKDGQRMVLCHGLVSRDP